jgi:hypothetical protein
LRAARDLAFVMVEPGERGFDTPELKEVKALLDELRA